MSLPVWNAHEHDLTPATLGAAGHGDAIDARGWQTPPGFGQRWGTDAIGASGWHTPELGRHGRRPLAATATAGWRASEVAHDGREQGAAKTTGGWRTSEPKLSPAGEEFARIVFELLWSEGGFGGTDVSGGRPLDCVWSSLDGCACGVSIPVDAVASAWARELDTTGELEDRFFHFIWEGGVWVAYGLADGEVRGVQCPSHNSERAARSHAARFGEGIGVGEIVCELALAA
jgi:hypothetical protein